MTCKKCGQTEIIKTYKPNNVEFLCKNDHIWHEDYIENGGVHQRPQSYEVELEDILFPSEKDLYNSVLKEIQKDMEFYTNSNPETITSRLINECKFDKDDIYKLFKKITAFNNHYYFS